MGVRKETCWMWGPLYTVHHLYMFTSKRYVTRSMMRHILNHNLHIFINYHNRNDNNNWVGIQGTPRIFILFLSADHTNRTKTARRAKPVMNVGTMYRYLFLSFDHYLLLYTFGYITVSMDFDWLITNL